MKPIIDSAELERALEIARSVSLTGGPIKPRSVKLLAKMLIALHEQQVHAVLDSMAPADKKEARKISPLVVALTAGAAGFAWANLLNKDPSPKDWVGSLGSLASIFNPASQSAVEVATAVDVAPIVPLDKERNQS